MRLAIAMTSQSPSQGWDLGACLLFPTCPNTAVHGPNLPFHRPPLTAGMRCQARTIGPLPDTRPVGTMQSSTATSHPCR